MGQAQDRTPELMGVLIGFMVLSTIAIAARCYTRIALTKVFSIEDWLSVVTLIFYGAFTATSLLSVHYGTGKHTEDIPLEQRPIAMMYRWIAITFYIIVSGLTKVIVSLFLTRVCTKQRWQNITLWTIIVVVSVYTVFYAVLNINSCHPISWEFQRFGFDPPDPSGCNSTLLATIPTYISAIINVIADWILAILPATILWNLKLERRLKISTYMVLAVGSLASIATLVRLPYASGLLSSGDYMYRFTDIAIWSTVEIGSALSASGLATLKPLFRKINAFASSNPSGRASGTADGSYELHKPRFSIPPILNGRKRTSMRLKDEESQFPRRDEPVVVDVTAENENSRYTEPYSYGVHKEVSVTHGAYKSGGVAGELE